MTTKSVKTAHNSSKTFIEAIRDYTTEHVTKLAVTAVVAVPMIVGVGSAEAWGGRPTFLSGNASEYGYHGDFHGGGFRRGGGFNNLGDRLAGAAIRGAAEGITFGILNGISGQQPAYFAPPVYSYGSGGPTYLSGSASPYSYPAMGYSYPPTTYPSGPTFLSGSASPYYVAPAAAPVYSAPVYSNVPTYMATPAPVTITPGTVYVNNKPVHLTIVPSGPTFLSAGGALKAPQQGGTVDNRVDIRNSTTVVNPPAGTATTTTERATSSNTSAGQVTKINSKTVVAINKTSAGSKQEIEVLAQIDRNMQNQIKLLQRHTAAAQNPVKTSQGLSIKIPNAVVSAVGWMGGVVKDVFIGAVGAAVALGGLFMWNKKKGKKAPSVVP